MHGLARISRRTVANFDPEKTHEVISVLKAAIQHAKAMKDWEAGLEAAKWIAEEQRLFVVWWDATVQDAGGDRQSKKALAQTCANGLSQDEAERKTKIKHQLVSRWRPQIAKPDYPYRILKPSHTAAMGEIAGRHGHLEGQYEWYTPEDIIEAARTVMGGIDLDPASNAHANKIVRAKKYYAEKDNGLEKQWAGRIFINPPFAHPIVKYFAEKLLHSFSDGSVEQAVWLSNATVDVEWWQNLAATGVTCFHRGRVKFYGEDGTLQPPTLGQSIFYLGGRRAKFAQAFNQFGVVMQPHVVSG